MIQRSAEDFSKEIETALDSFVKTYGIEDKLEAKIVLEAQEDGSVKKEIYVNGKKLVLEEFPAEPNVIPVDGVPEEIQSVFLGSDAPVDEPAPVDENAAADSASDAPSDEPNPADDAADATPVEEAAPDATSQGDEVVDA